VLTEPTNDLPMPLTDTIIPVYNFIACAGGKDFAIVKSEPDEIITSLHAPHRHEGYSITLLLRGRITQFIDFEKYTIAAPAVISMAPDQIAQFVSTEDCEMICISFNKEFLITEMMGWIACWECMFGHVVMDIGENSVRELKTYADLMLEEFYSDKPKKELIIRNLLNAFIIACARIRSHHLTVMQMDAVQNKLVQQFKYQVDTHFREKTQVAQYADMLYVTPGHLNDVIKSTVGKTAKQVIDEKRITEAKRLLFWGDHNMKEIAWQLKFEDDSYFNRFFKKHTGHTPSLFQRMIREKYN
jgi:AraC-like DNA-binding protein